MKKKSDRNYWVWCTRIEYYLDEKGVEIYEGCEYEDNITGWWTCHPDTKKGDFAFLWRLNPKQDLGYLFQVETDANIFDGADKAQQPGLEYVCDYKLIYKFEAPLKRIDLEMNRYLSDWSALKGNFRKPVFKIPEDMWFELNKHLKNNNPKYIKLIEKLESLPKEFILEEENLENFLFANIHFLNKFGYKLFIYKNVDMGITGRQVIVKQNDSKIDLLCYDKKNDCFVVIALKIANATNSTFTQVNSFMKWIKKNIAGDKDVTGLIISPGNDIKFQSAIETVENIKQINIDELNFPFEFKFK